MWVWCGGDRPGWSKGHVENKRGGGSVLHAHSPTLLPPAP